MAVSRKFGGKLRKLTRAFIRHDKTERSVENLSELSSHRAALEDARVEMRDVRREDGIVTKERSSPRWVDPTIGLGSTSWAGKVGALIAAAVLAVLLFVTVVWIQGVGSSKVLVVEVVSESLVEAADGSCSWQVQFEIENVSDEPIYVRHVRTTVRDSAVRFAFVLSVDDSGVTHRDLDPAGVTTGQVTWVASTCVSSLETVKHSPIEVTYWNLRRVDKTESFNF